MQAYVARLRIGSRVGRRNDLLEDKIYQFRLLRQLHLEAVILILLKCDLWLCPYLHAGSGPITTYPTL